MKDSWDNEFVRAEVGGGGPAPIWHLRDWWQGAHVDIYTPRRKLAFYFPEGRLVDILAHSIAHVWNWVYSVRHNRGGSGEAGAGGGTT